MMNYKVSVIIPTYGRAKYLLRAIDSVLTQSYENIEVIVVDDNDNEQHHIDTIQGLEKYTCLPNLIYFYDGCNRGGALARNQGINLATGEYITFLDDDDYYLPNKIETQLKHIVSNKLDVSVCNMYFNQDNKMLDVSNCYARVESLSAFILNGNSYTPMIMSKKDTLLEAGLFTETPRFQDHVLMIKLFEIGAKIDSLNEKLFVHNYHAEERVTFSKKSGLGYRIRQYYENRNLHFLNPSEFILYSFHNLLLEAKLLRIEGNYLGALKCTLKSIKYVRGYNQYLKIIKTFIRIHIFPNRPV